MQVWKEVAVGLQLPDRVVPSCPDKACDEQIYTAMMICCSSGACVGQCLGKITEMVETNSSQAGIAKGQKALASPAVWQVALLNLLSSTMRCSKVELHSCSELSKASTEARTALEGYCHQQGAETLVQRCDEHVAAYRIATTSALVRGAPGGRA